METTTEVMHTGKIAYIRSVGPYGLANKQAMEQLKEWAKTNDLLNDDAVILGIAQDDPSQTKPENCRYDTCIIISESFTEMSDTMNIGRLQGGKYCVFTVEHTVQGVQEAWRSLFAELSKNDFSFDISRPIIERYKMSMVKQHLCEICVPIV